MKFENEKLGCSFEVPDRPNVRQQLGWFSEMSETVNQTQFERYWEAGKTLIENWQCDVLPDPSVSLDEMTNPIQTQVVIWAGLQIVGHMNRLEDIEKN